MTVMASIRQKITGLALIGFFIPIALAIAVALLLHRSQSTPVMADTQTDRNSGSQSAAATTPASPPTADEVAAANAAILAYCTNDLRQDTNCALIPHSNTTAPGFVESGVRMSGFFEGSNTVTDGSGLAKGSGTNWTVIWVGQGCIPRDVATKNNVARSLDVCAS